MSEKINKLFIEAGWTPVKNLSDFDENSLTEDIAQYKKDKIIVDFGFYGDELTSTDGEYIIFIILNQDWDNHLAKFTFKSKSMAIKTLETLPSLLRDN